MDLSEKRKIRQGIHFWLLVSFSDLFRYLLEVSLGLSASRTGRGESLTQSAWVVGGGGGGFLRATLYPFVLRRLNTRYFMEIREKFKKIGRLSCPGVISHQFSKIGWQFLLLIYKNFKLQLRRPIGTITELILPIVSVVFIVILRRFLNFETEQRCFTTFEPDQLIISERVIPNYPAAVYIHYAPQTPDTTEVMDIVRKEIILANPIKLVFSSFATEKEVLEELGTFHGNDTTRFNYCYNEGAGIIFNSLDGNELSYTIRLPHEVGGSNSWSTLQTSPNFERPGPRRTNLYLSEGFLQLQRFVGNAIVEWRAKKEKLPYQPVKVYVRQLPYPEYSVDEFLSRINIILPLLFVLSFLYTAGITVKELVLEKETRIRESMLMMGLKQWVLWATWFTKQFIFLLPSVVILTCLVKLFMFTNSNWLLIFIFFILYIASMISFSFFVSVWFNSARVGLIVGFITWFGSFCPFLFLVFRYRSTAFGYIFISCLLSNTALGFGIEVIARLEQQTVGLSWSNIAEPITIDDSFNMAWVLIMLLIDSVLYLTLTLYVNEVKPGQYGVPKPLYFPFLPSYWCSARQLTSKLKKMQSFVQEDPSAHERVRGKPAVGISIRSLTKVYSTSCGKHGVRKKAVDNLNLDVYKGQITALLGHNGAGKTTTMSILTGLFTPTEGTAIINGYNILTDMVLIRDSLGICPQHNVLFDRLTVREHLSFFMLLKGVHDRRVVKAEVDQMISDLLLTDKGDIQASLLSGGMKRKLSVGIALIGGSEVVILDEPTAGMDPYARRATWDLLGKYKRSCCILMSTHLMDEADLLGDRIAIMSEGKLRCSGSSLFLKSRYGIGYHMTLVKESHCVSSEVEALVRLFVPSAEKVTDVGMELSFILPSSDASKFPDLFDKLESTKASLGIGSFGVSITTMEEVFLKVGEDNNGEALKSSLNKKHSITIEAAKQRERKLRRQSEEANKHKHNVNFSSNGDNLHHHPSDIDDLESEQNHYNERVEEEGNKFPSSSKQEISGLNQTVSIVAATDSTNKQIEPEPLIIPRKDIANTSSKTDQYKATKKTHFNLVDEEKEKQHIDQLSCKIGPIHHDQRLAVTQEECPSEIDRERAIQPFDSGKSSKPHSLYTGKQRNVITLPPLGTRLVIKVTSNRSTSDPDDIGRKQNVITLPPIEMTLIHALKLDYHLSGSSVIEIGRRLQPLPPIRTTGTVGPMMHEYELPSTSDDTSLDQEMLAYQYEPNDGIVLWLQQFRAMFIKRLYYFVRFYPSLVIQVVFPVLFATIGLLAVLTYPKADDPPRALHISNAGLNLRNTTVFYAELDGKTMNFSDFTAKDLSVTSYNDITAGVNELRNSVKLISDLNECCNYKYQLLDNFCASRNTADLEHCKDKSSSFGYSRCISCLKCCFAYANIRSCTHPITLIRRSTNNCPSPPSLSLHADSTGPLDTTNTFIMEYILRLASKTGAVPFFRVYQAGFTVATQDPIISACDCAKDNGKSMRGCSIFAILNDLDSNPKDSCPFLRASSSITNSLKPFNETLCKLKPSCYTVEPYSEDYLRYITCVLDGCKIYSDVPQSNQSNVFSNRRSISTVYTEYLPTAAVTVWYNNGPYHMAAAAFNTYQNMLLKQVTRNKNLSMVVINHPLPRDPRIVAEDAIQDFTGFALSILALFGYSFFLSTFVVFLVKEKESKAKHLQFVSGVSATSYWLSALTLDLVNACLPIFLTVIVFRVFPVDAYHGSALISLLLILVLTCWAAIPLTYIFSFIFKNSLAAFSTLLIIFFFITVLLLIAVFLVQLFGKENKTEIAESLHYTFLLSPTYGLASTLNDIFINQQTMDFCLQNYNICDYLNLTYVESTLIFERPGVGATCVYLMIEGVAFIAITILLELKFFIPHVKRFLIKIKKEGYPQVVSKVLGEDEDVYAERKRVISGDTGEDVIIIKNLVKIYHNYIFGCSRHSPKTAVDSICLGIPSGECFGLLGVNGAGKTTTFSILTGDIGTTSGTAIIAKNDIRTSMQAVRQGLGYCPQFDALIECMTGYELLWMYARLRGVPEDHINEVVNTELQRLDFMKYASKTCGTYSGGVKRKLSAAIAMIGNPPIILLDEPTNGMDPNTRRYLWNVLTKIVREGKSIILTSHSMEECEALCTRLAIMVNGRFKCLGSIQHLKNKYGSGITLQAKVKRLFDSIYDRKSRRHFSVQSTKQQPFRRKSSIFSWQYYKRRARSFAGGELIRASKTSIDTSNLYDTTDLHTFIIKNFSGAILMDEHVGAVTYWLPNEEVSWSSVFRLLEENKEDLGIVDYSVSQTTLEQVFINFAKEQEDNLVK